MKQLNLPENMDIEVLGQYEDTLFARSKNDYVIWTIEDNGGVCGGTYFPLDQKEQAKSCFIQRSNLWDENIPLIPNRETFEVFATEKSYNGSPISADQAEALYGILRGLCNKGETGYCEGDLLRLTTPTGFADEINEYWYLYSTFEALVDSELEQGGYASRQEAEKEMEEMMNSENFPQVFVLGDGTYAQCVK